MIIQKKLLKKSSIPKYYVVIPTNVGINKKVEVIEKNTVFKYLQIHINFSLKSCVIIAEFVKNLLLNSYGSQSSAGKKFCIRKNKNKVDPIETWRTVIVHLLP